MSAYDELELHGSENQEALLEVDAEAAPRGSWSERVHRDPRWQVLIGLATITATVLAALSLTD